MVIKRKLFPEEIKRRKSKEYFSLPLNNWKGRYKEAIMCEDLRDYIKNDQDENIKD